MVYDLETIVESTETMPRVAPPERRMDLIRSAKLMAGAEFFNILATTDRTQIATMVLQNGQVSGNYGTDHPEADQTFYVLEGTGQLVLDSGDTELRVGDSGLIPAGSKHQFMGKSERAFRTLNIYTSVAYPVGA